MAVDQAKQARGTTGVGQTTNPQVNLKLGNGCRVAVIGAGPAGSLFSYFLLDMAERMGWNLRVDIYESRDFSLPGPTSCNMCGGIVSESLVQNLAAEGVTLPPGVVQRGIDSYMLHTEDGEVRIDTPVRDKRIAAVYRGAGPRGMKESKWRSFDGYLLELAIFKGVHLIRERVEKIVWQEGRPQVKTRTGGQEIYDLVAVAVGVNAATQKLLEGLELNYEPPQTTRTYICEFSLGEATVKEYFGNSMHVFLLNIPRLEFAALIPKGDYVTLCMLGREIDQRLVQSFLEAPPVKQCFPPGWSPPPDSCHCSPKINVGPARHPFDDRIVFIGDCGITRLYKDGIGAAYRVAKAAARTVVFHGVAAADFRRHYWPVCRAIHADNRIGGMIFAVTRLIPRIRPARRGVLSMVANEQRKQSGGQRLSTALWDVFTGSAPYREVFLRFLHPFFLAGLVWNTATALWFRRKQFQSLAHLARTDLLGKVFHDGDVIVKQGDLGNCMYVILAGRVEILQQQSNRDVRLAVLQQGDFFGEMSLFEHEVRSATVRAIGEVRIVTVDQETFLQHVHSDPSLAFRIVRGMSHRIRTMNDELARLKSGD
jgi:flavin-dependent dehydrogenase